MIKLFLLVYLQILLLTAHSRLANRCEYRGMVVVGSIIGVLYFSLFKQIYVMMDEPYAIWIYTTGSVCGALSGAWLHNRLARRNKDETLG